MSQVPPAFTPQTTFAALALQPITRAGLPGGQLDAEFGRAAASVNQTIARLGEIQRDDGKLKNGVVSLSAMAPDVYALLISLGVNPKVWLPGDSIKKGDLVSNPATVAQLVISGSLSGTGGPFVMPILYPAGTSEGKTYWTNTGAGPYNASVRWSGGLWVIDNHATGIGAWTSTEDVATPDLVTAWTPSIAGTAGTPILNNRTASSTVGTYLAIVDHVASSSFSTNLTKWALIAAKQAAGDLIVNSFTGNGTATTFTLSVAPIEEVNTQVFVNGLYQPKSVYSLAGTSVIFATAPANLAAIEVVSGIPAQSAILTPADYSVTTLKLAAFAVTAEKVANDAVSTAKILNAAVTTDKLANGSVTTDKLAPGSITAEKLTFNSVGTGILVDDSVTNSKIANNAITTAKIANGSITSAKLAAGPVELQGLVTAPVTPFGIVTKEYFERDNSISNAMLSQSSVSTSKVADAAITGAKLSRSGKMPCQIQYSTKNGVQTISTAGWQDVTGLEVTIDRVNLTGRMRVQASIACASDSTSPVVFRVLRNNTVPVGVGGTSGVHLEICAAGGSNVPNVGLSSVHIDFVDDISGSASVTHAYKVQAYIFSGSGYINRTAADANTNAGPRALSSITLTELTG